MDKLPASPRVGEDSRVARATLAPTIRVMEVDLPEPLGDMASHRDLPLTEALVVGARVDMEVSRVVVMVEARVVMEERDTRFDSTTKLPRQRQMNVGPRTSIG